MASTRSRIQHKVKQKHRARKPRPVRPLDEPKKDNHAARHEAKKVKRVAHEALLAKQAKDAATMAEFAALQAAEAEFAALEAAAPAPSPYHHNCGKLVKCDECAAAEAPRPGGKLSGGEVVALLLAGAGGIS